MSVLEPAITEQEMASPIEVLVVDDNSVIRMGLRSLLGTSDAIKVVGEAADGVEAVEKIEQLKPDIALLDVRMPRRDGLEVIKEVHERVKVIMLTYTDGPEVIRQALSTGARGYLVHGSFSAEEIERAILTVADGNMLLTAQAAEAMVQTTGAESASEAKTGAVRSQAGLSRRQVEIMDLIADGLTNGEIARACFVAEKTVKNHVNQIFAKLGVRTRAEAVSEWLTQ